MLNCCVLHCTLKFGN